MSKIGNNLIKQYFGKTSSETVTKKSMVELIGIISAITHVKDIVANKEESLALISDFKEELSKLNIDYPSPKSETISVRHIKGLLSSLKLLIPHMQDEGLNAGDRSSPFMTGIGILNQIEQALKKL
jgi:hypothetical protein